MFTLVRLRVFIATAVLTGIGVRTYYQVVVADETLRFFESLSLFLFAILFGWIAFSFSMAVEGFVAQQVSRSSFESSLRSRTRRDMDSLRGKNSKTSNNAILVPVYNESPTRVFAAVAAMRGQLSSDQRGNDRFDFFVLSDSTDPEVWLEEELCWRQLVSQFDQVRSDEGTQAASIRIYYRHRSANTSRKAGNIADFCENWGAHYEHMIVLDADSLMDGETILEMVARMKADNELGILQVPPVPIGRWSVFARLQQFAAAVYGATFAEGFHQFAGNQGNYWGHNAIIRVSAFMRHCNLPVLSGPPPLGGEILSHDFVEASLMVKAGWKVKLANDLGGSYEECPTTILDFVKRDHRWCQGNLQHWQIMMAEGIHPVSRLHFLSGIMAYAAAPLWMAFLMTSVVAAFVNHSYDGSSLSGDGSKNMLWLFIGSMGLLLVPKMLATAECLFNAKKRASLGGPLRILWSVVVESICSIIFAPILALYHTRIVISVLLGQTVQWNAQQRDEQGVSWREAIHQMWPMTITGAAIVVMVVLIRPQWLGWISPIALGWTLSIPIAVAMGSQRLGQWMCRRGLLRVPSEQAPLPILTQHQHWISEIEAFRVKSSCEPGGLFDHLLQDPTFRQQHLAILRASENQVPMQEVEPDSAFRCDLPDLSARDSAASRRGLLCDERWLESVS